MRKLFVLFVFGLLCQHLQAQLIDLGKGFSRDKEAQEDLRVAEEFYDIGNYTDALPHYRKLESKYSSAPILSYRIGVCLIFKSDENADALRYLLQVKAQNKKAANIDYWLGRAYHINNRFDSASYFLTSYLAGKYVEPKLKPLAEKYIHYSTNGIEISARPLDVKVYNLGDKVNTSGSEYVPVLSSDETTLLYTYRGERSRGGKQSLPGVPSETGDYFEDIYITNKDSSNWFPPSPLDTNINSFGHDACISLSNDGQTLIVFKNTEAIGDVGDIYFSRLNGFRWSTPVRLEGDVNTVAWEGSASLSADEKTLYFASEREGGYGGRDIYTATLQPDGRWGNVRNLGSRINTPDNDDAPFIHPNGVTLLFSSEGHKSIGGYDIFVSEMLPGDSSWSEPRNIGFPINTAGDDKYFQPSLDGNRGYYSSGKSGGFGQQDLYMIDGVSQVPKTQVLTVSGYVTMNGEPVDAIIQVKEEGKVVERFKLHSNAQTGKYLVNLRKGAHYELVYHTDGDIEDVVRPIDATTDLNSWSKMEVNVKIFSFQFLQSEVNRVHPDSVRDPDMRPLIKKYGIKATVGETASTIKLTKSDTVKTVHDTLHVADTSKANKPMTYDEMLARFGSSKKAGLHYRVQVAAYQLPKNYNANSLAALGKIEEQVLGDGITRFVIGTFDTLAEADAFRLQVIAAGTTDAFITAIYQNRRWLLADLAQVNFNP